MQITGVYSIHFLINVRNMQAPFIVTKEATSNIIGMNVIRTYKLKMDMLTIRVTTTLDNVASLQTSDKVWHYIDAKRETNWKFGPSWEIQSRGRDEPFDQTIPTRKEKLEKTVRQTPIYGHGRTTSSSNGQ
jgi:hypothetical protein